MIPQTIRADAWQLIYAVRNGVHQFKQQAGAPFGKGNRFSASTKINSRSLKT